MKQLVRTVCLLLLMALLIGAVSAESFTPDSSGVNVIEADLSAIRSLGSSPDDNYRTFYEIFVYSFCDSDGDGIGDLQGVIRKLDYLQELGINGIWLMPIHPSRSYHKYDVADYTAIDPQYGTMADVEALLAACAQRDIHVILDLVINHTGGDHPWFTQACDYLSGLRGDEQPDAAVCPYLAYYHFTREPTAAYYYPVGDSGWYYEGRFSPDMPDLDLASEAVRREIADIMAFWLGKGVSGFRLDAAKEYFSGSTGKNMEVLNWLTAAARGIDPEVYLVAEVWEGFSTVADYYASGIPSLFAFPFGDSSGKIVKVLQGMGNAKTVSSYAAALEKADGAYLAKNPDYIDAPFLSNHDTGRIAGFCGRDAAKIKLAGAMNLFMSGSAFIYYGEELGMLGSGNDPSKRAPMLWNEGRDNGTTQPPPDCQLPESYLFGSLETQEGDPLSIYNYYRRAIGIRQALPVISHGRTTAETALNTGCVSAQRKTWGEENCLILMNIDTAAARVDLSAYAGWTLAATLTVDAEPVTEDGSILTLPACGIAILTF